MYANMQALTFYNQFLMLSLFPTIFLVTEKLAPSSAAIRLHKKRGKIQDLSLLLPPAMQHHQQ